MFDSCEASPTVQWKLSGRAASKCASVRPLTARVPSRLLGAVLICFISLAFLAGPVKPQTPAPETVGPTLKTSARLVAVDVVVTDAGSNPVPGLRKGDFEVFEDGTPQTISVFEEHAGKSPAPIKQPELPPNTFSNFPRADAPDSLNVVLLDALNTPLHDQAFVHQQVIKYLTGLQTSEPIAIFILSTRLRMVHGFTSDLSELLAALNEKKAGSSPQASPLLRSGGEIHAQEQATQQMQSLAVLDPHIQSAVDALRQFQSEQESSNTSDRAKTTLSSMRYLAQYLAGFPGRKNVIWFSGAFPLTLLSESSPMGLNVSYLGEEEELRKTGRVARPSNADLC